MEISSKLAHAADAASGDVGFVLYELGKELLMNESLPYLGSSGVPCDAPVLNQSAKDHVVAKAFLGIFYPLVFVIAITGNGLVIYVVVSNRTMQTVTNLFITNLAFSDVVVSLTSLWLTPIYTYLGRWVWGGPACYLFAMLQGASIFISTFTLAAIAIDRYVVIMNPFRSRMKMSVCVTIILSIWVTSFMLVTPYVFNMVYEAHECGYYVCYEDWSIKEMRNIYGLVVLALQYGIPIVIITFCYACISVRLQQRVIPGTRSAEREERDLKRKRRLNKMLILMVVIFGLCWLPMNILNIVRDQMRGIFQAYYFMLIFMLGHLVGMSATCWNPILYGFMNENFRQEFKAVLPCFSETRLHSSLSTKFSQSVMSFNQSFRSRSNSANLMRSRANSNNCGDSSQRNRVMRPVPPQIQKPLFGNSNNSSSQHNHHKVYDANDEMIVMETTTLIAPTNDADAAHNNNNAE